MTEQQIKTFLKFWKMIEESPSAEHGETIVHSDGGVTENRWRFTAPTAGRDRT